MSTAILVPTQTIPTHVKTFQKTSFRCSIIIIMIIIINNIYIAHFFNGFKALLPIITPSGNRHNHFVSLRMVVGQAHDLSALKSVILPTNNRYQTRSGKRSKWE